MTTKGIVVITLAAALGLLTAIGVIVSPAAEATIAPTQDNATATNGGNQSSFSNATQTNATQTGNQTMGGNQTTATAEELTSALVTSLKDNITSGDAQVVVITRSNQPDVPEQQEMRDIDPLGLVSFDDTGMQIMQPENATTRLGGSADSTSTLYAGGQMTFLFENIALEPPNDVDVIIISKDGDELRFPTVIDNTGIDAEFAIPAGLTDGEDYLVLVAMSWPDLGQDVVMGIDGTAVVNGEEE